MRQIEKTIKKGIFRKLLIKLCRLVGYELIDQADMSFVTSMNKYNASTLGEKSITLPMGEVKITRNIQFVFSLIEKFDRKLDEKKEKNNKTVNLCVFLFVLGNLL